MATPPTPPPSAAAIAARIPGRELAQLTEATTLADAYQAALAHCAGAATRAGGEIDWSRAEACEALRLRTWYELYAANEGEAVARDKADQADRLLAALLGDAAVVSPGKGAPHATPSAPATGAAKPGPRPSILDGFPGAPRRLP